MYPSSNSEHYKLERRRFRIRSFLAFSFLFQIVFVFLATIMLLNRWLPQVAVTSPNQPTENYSTFWAICTAASIIWALFASGDFYSIRISFQYHPYLIGIFIAQLIVATLVEFPVAVYFARKYTIAVPGVYLVPAKVICCGKKKISALLVRTVFLLTSLTVIQFTFFHCTFLLLALGAAPFNITSSIAMVLFFCFATVHILAILFTLPSLCRQTIAMGAANRGEKCQAIIQGVALVILLVAIFCFSVVVASCGHLINIGTDQSFLPALSKVTLSLVLGLASYFLRRLSNMWWETLSRRTQSVFPNESVDEAMSSKSDYDAI